MNAPGAGQPPRTLLRRLVAEWIGTFSLLATVVGSGIMAECLAGGNVAVALLGNTLPTGAIVVVLITVFGRISGATPPRSTSWHRFWAGSRASLRRL